MKLRHVLLLAVTTFAGCAVTHREYHYLPEHAHRAEVTNDGRWCTVALAPDPNSTTFRHRTVAGRLFPGSPWAEQMLEFVIPNDSLVAGAKLELAELQAWSLARPYDRGVGLLQEGNVHILSVSPGRIELSITSSLLASTFTGPCVFQRVEAAWPPAKGLIQAAGDRNNSE